jgi:dTDP-4-dehydrorhamnose reductase
MSRAAPILVVGKSGQVAQCLSRLCSHGNSRLVVVGRPALDIEDADSVGRMLGRVEPGAVINVAAYTAVDKAEAEPERCYAVNRDGAVRLATAAWQSGAAFIQISTDYVFDGQKPSPYVEVDGTAPLSVYGRSKLEAEQAVLSAHPQAVILRTSWIYSEFGSNFLKTMLRLGMCKSVLRIVDDQCGCPTSAHELATALTTIASRLIYDGAERYSGIYHLSGSDRTTWYGFAREIFANAETRGTLAPRLEPITTREYPTPAKRPCNSALNCEKAERVLGVKLPPWSSSVRYCIRQLANHKELQIC